MKTFDIVVIGGGPAGMATACAAAGCGMRVALVEREPVLGGILNQCTHMGFGLTYFGEELTGQEYARRCIALIDSSDVEVFTDTTVMGIGADRVITVSGAETRLRRIQAKAVVLATGCRERPIGALPVAGSRPAGVYMAGAAQKMLNLGGYDIGDKFVILGSGDIGLIVARELVTRGKEVIAVIEKEAECGGLARNRINCLERYGIPLITCATVSEVHGMPRVSGVTVTDQSGARRFIACDALITSVGLIPERDLLDGITAEIVPDWLFLCGNAAFVHDVVDDVTVESERVGRLAAAYVAPNGEVRCQGLEDGCEEDKLRCLALPLSAEEGVKAARRGASPALYKLRESPPYVCVACPKGCVAVRIEGGWSGLACGRAEPKTAL